MRASHLRYASVMILLLGLSACSSIEKPTDPKLRTESVPAMSQAPAVETSQPAASDSGQNELTAELLYDLLLANIAFQAGEVEVSAEALIRAAEASDDIVVLSRAVRMSVHSKRYADAVRLGSRWVGRAPAEQQAYTITALAAVMDGQVDVAYELVHTLMEQDKDKLDLRFQQFGEVFLQYANKPAATEVAQRLAEAYPKQVQAWLVMAGIAQKNKDFATMEKAIDHILLLEPDNQIAAEYKLLVLSEDRQSQTDFATKFLSRNPQADDFRMLFAKRLLQAEDTDAAIEQLLLLLKHDKTNVEAINLLALLYQSQESYPEAVKYFERKLELMPDDDRTRLYLANALQQLQRYDEARQVLDEVTAEEERFNAHRQAILLIEQAEGAEAALAYLDTLQDSDQAESIQLVIDKESLLKRAGREAEASAVIDAGIAHYPQDETLLYHRALNAVEQLNLQSHEADMRVLLTRDPDNAHYNNTLGYSLLTLSDRLEDAAVLIDKAHLARPDDPYILDSKGWLEYKRGALDAALEYLLKAFVIDQDAEIAAHLGEIYWALGNPDKAREYWEKGDTIDPDNKSLIETKARFLGSTD